jgi:hypothetical protein
VAEGAVVKIARFWVGMLLLPTTDVDVDVDHDEVAQVRLVEHVEQCWWMMNIKARQSWDYAAELSGADAPLSHC